MAAIEPLDARALLSSTMVAWGVDRLALPAASAAVAPAEDVTPPVITGLRMLPARCGHGVAAVRLTFSEPMAPGPVSNPASYSLFAQYPFMYSGGSGAFGDGMPVKIRSASYEPATNSVLLRPVRPIPDSLLYALRSALDQDYQLVSPLTDLAGNPLNGVGGSASSVGYFTVNFARGRVLKLENIDPGWLIPNGVSVFRLQGKGTLEFVNGAFVAGDSSDPSAPWSEIRILGTRGRSVTLIGRGIGPDYRYFTYNPFWVVSPVPVTLRLVRRSGDSSFPSFQVAGVLTPPATW